MKIQIHFDGSGTKGPCAIGWQIKSENGGLISQHSEQLSEATNNIAEWYALTNALRYVQKILPGVKEIDIRGDSQLVIYQLQNIYQCKAEHLVPFKTECRQILKEYSWTATWIRREENKEADALSKRHLEKPNE